mmetsp:Transcript_604/g.1983  ORF Transcript_604/g.1983 Transcript_604/m.1983 type:complete len:115 (-) Transcript_604:103-447(-)
MEANMPANRPCGIGVEGVEGVEGDEGVRGEGGVTACNGRQIAGVLGRPASGTSSHSAPTCPGGKGSSGGAVDGAEDGAVDGVVDGAVDDVGESNPQSSTWSFVTLAEHAAAAGG